MVVNCTDQNKSDLISATDLILIEIFLENNDLISATDPHPEGFSCLRHSGYPEQPSDTARARTSPQTRKPLRTQTQSR